MYNVCTISLGCEKNRVNTELALGCLNKSKYNLISEPLLADAIIINTCGFIEDAKTESINEIFNVINLKKIPNSKLKSIIVMGCLSERYQMEFAKEFPEVDGVMGIGSIDKIEEILDSTLKGNKVQSFIPKDSMILSGKRILTTPKYYAYLKIADGCSNKCTYCAIPIIRGEFRSREISDIVDETKFLIKNGAKEIILIAQDTTRYGQDIYGKLSLVDLLKNICALDGNFYIRLLYCYPDRITDELIDFIATEPKILKYIDIPLQHCNGKILKSMNRTGNFDSLSALMEKLRLKIPNIVIRTTFICGFPGETDTDFNELLDFIRKQKFERLGFFKFSKEEDTPAYKMKNQIDDAIKERRYQMLMSEQQKIMENFCNSQIWKLLNVLVEGFDDDSAMWYGRSYMDAPDIDTKVYFVNNKEDLSINIGDVVLVKVISCDDLDLIGICE